MHAVGSVLTVGHSTHSPEAFLSLLTRHQVTAIADVRSAPYSRRSPQFNKANLRRALKNHGVRYVFLGIELGARSSDHSLYVNGRVQYRLLAESEPFLRGIDRLLRGMRSHRVAIMCAEKEPLECHRTLLVARALHERGVRVDHILGDGTSETHEHAMARLLDATGVPREDLFHTYEELISLALAKQEERIAYVDESLSPASEVEDQ